MPGVSGRGGASEADHALAHDVDVLRRDRRELAPQLVEGVAVEAARARVELGRVDQVRRSDLRDMDLKPGVLADENSCRSCVIEMDVRIVAGGALP